MRSLNTTGIVWSVGVTVSLVVAPLSLHAAPTSTRIKQIAPMNEDLQAALRSNSLSRIKAALTWIGDRSQAARDLNFQDRVLAGQFRPLMPRIVPLTSHPEREIRQAAWLAIGKMQFAEGAEEAWRLAITSNNPEVYADLLPAVKAYLDRTSSVRLEINGDERNRILANLSRDALAIVRLTEANTSPEAVELRTASIKAFIDSLSGLETLTIEGQTAQGGADLAEFRKNLLQITRVINGYVSKQAQALPRANLPSKLQTLEALEGIANWAGDRVPEKRRFSRNDFAPEGTTAVREIRETYLLLKPTLLTLSRDESLEVRIQVIQVVEALGQFAEPYLELFLQGLRSENPMVRWAACRAIGRLKPAEGAKAVLAVGRLMNDEDIDVRSVACLTLKAFGKLSQPAVPMLADSLASTDPELRLRVVEALEAIGSESEAALPAMILALKSTDVRVRRRIPGIIVKLGEKARPAIPALREATNDPEREVRVLAAQALLKLPAD